ncbi:MAG: hypothetical protein ACOC16_02235 [Nanoarchaeota archaeon]
MTLKNKNIEEYAICQMPDIKLSCYGCCGRNYTDKKDIIKDIQDNTKDFKKLILHTKFNLYNFRERFSRDSWKVKKSGICSNLVKFRNGLYACPLHISINKIIPKSEFRFLSKKDLRWGHCDVNFKCITVEIFKKLNNNQKQQYIKWIKNLKIDSHNYSINNIQGKLIKQFLQKNNNDNFTN